MIIIEIMNIQVVEEGELQMNERACDIAFDNLTSYLTWGKELSSEEVDGFIDNLDDLDAGYICIRALNWADGYATDKLSADQLKKLSSKSKRNYAQAILDQGIECSGDVRNILEGIANPTEAKH